MARKKKEEAQKTRQQLIEAAIRLFATRGVASTTLTDIADAAQPTRGRFTGISRVKRKYLTQYGNSNCRCVKSFVTG